MASFYDEQMTEMVDSALDYLMSERGQSALREAARKSKELSDKFRKMRDVPWEKLHAPFTVSPAGDRS